MKATASARVTWVINMLSETDGRTFSTSGITSAAELEKDITANNFQFEKWVMRSMANPTITARAKLHLNQLEYHFQPGFGLDFVPETGLQPE